MKFSWYCLRYCSHHEVNLPLLPEKRREKFVDPSKRKEIVCPLLIARAKQSLVSKSLVLQCLVGSQERVSLLQTAMLFLDRV